MRHVSIAEHIASAFTLRRRTLAALTCVSFGVLLAGCAARPRATQGDPQLADAEPGSNHFRSYCAACHQYDGQGMGAAPPLAGSSWVTGPEKRLIRIVLHGVEGPMEVQGQTYDREMPGFGNILTDAEVASLLTFVRRRFGQMGKPISTEAVSRVRAATPERTDYWTVDELLADP